MTATYGPFDRTSLNALSPNLDTGDVADPALRLAYFQYLADYGDAMYTGVKADIASKISAGTLSALGIINVKDYGASGSDTTTTGNLASGSQVLVVASTDTYEVGHGISVAGAGAAGADLVTSITSIVGTNVFLADEASTTVSGATVSHDDTAAIQAAVEAIESDAGGTLYLPNGTYRTSTTITCTTSNVLFFGYGAEIRYTGAVGTQALHVYGTIETAKSITSSITAEDNSFTVSSVDSASFISSDYVKIVSDENYFVYTERDYKKGELVKVSSVDNDTGVITIEGKGIVLSYDATTSLPTAQKVNFIENIKIKGIKFTGTGTDDRQFGVQMDYAKNITIDDQNEISDFEVGIILADCLYVEISNNHIHDCNRASTGYGISLEGVTQRAEIHHNKMENNRHSFTTGGYDGVVMHIDVHHNQVFGDNNAGLNTHGNSRFARFCYNEVDHCDIGVSSYAPHTTIEGNRITHTNQNAIFLLEAGFINPIVRHNVIEYIADFDDAIKVENSGATNYGTNDYVIIENNMINNVPNGSAINVSASSPILVSIRNNDVSTVGFKGIIVVDGEKVVITGNNLHYSTRSGTSGNDGITAACTSDVVPFGSVLQITNNNVYRFNKAIKVTSADALLLNGNVCRSVSSNYDISGATAARTGSNYPSVYEATLTWNPASLTDGAGETSSAITVTGAAVGDFVSVSAPYDLQGITCSAYVSDADTVRIRIQNETGATIDLISGSWKIVVEKA